MGMPDLGMTLPIAESIRNRESKLAELGWSVVEIPGSDHTQMPPSVLVPEFRNVLDQHSW